MTAKGEHLSRTLSLTILIILCTLKNTVSCSAASNTLLGAIAAFYVYAVEDLTNQILEGYYWEQLTQTSHEKGEGGSQR